jgi:hypothetical protein
MSDHSSSGGAPAPLRGGREGGRSATLGTTAELERTGLGDADSATPWLPGLSLGARPLPKSLFPLPHILRNETTALRIPLGTTFELSPLASPVSSPLASPIESARAFSSADGGSAAASHSNRSAAWLGPLSTWFTWGRAPAARVDGRAALRSSVFGSSLLLHDGASPRTNGVEASTISLGGSVQSAPPDPAPSPRAAAFSSALDIVVQWSARFSVHVLLVSVFETIFFFLFVSKSEDDALKNLVGSYVDGILSTCSNWTSTERTLIGAVGNVFLNRTGINADSARAAVSRQAYNTSLYTNAWVYVAFLACLTVFFFCVAFARRLHVPWAHIFAENLALVCVLGLYELFFFKHVVFEYLAISVPELDALVVNELAATCFINSTAANWLGS